ncbi:MAG: metallophosphoesterase [Planctomycetota bacterium]
MQLNPTHVGNPCSTLPRRVLLGGMASYVLLGPGRELEAASPQTGVAMRPSDANDGSSWKLGLIADLHHGLAPDALGRLEAFIEASEKASPAAIMQMGDFNYGVDADDCMRVWRMFDGPKYHVLGNHDMDKTTKANIVDAWEMPAAYYSFDFRGWHFVVLDRNHLKTEDGGFIDYSESNFYVDGRLRGYADTEQLEWLTEDLSRTQFPTVVFSHQGLGMKSDDQAAGAIETVLAKSNRGSGKIRACFCGHHHIDRYNQRDGIHYVWINSASYHWVGSEYGRMAAYTDPLFTFLTFHPDQSIEVAGCVSDWATPTPKERDYPGWADLNTVIVGRRLTSSPRSND